MAFRIAVGVAFIYYYKMIVNSEISAMHTHWEKRPRKLEAVHFMVTYNMTQPAFNPPYLLHTEMRD